MEELSWHLLLLPYVGVVGILRQDLLVYELVVHLKLLSNIVLHGVDLDIGDVPQLLDSALGLL